MSGKPEDIPQDVWDAAAKCVPPYVSAKIITDIARAILAERERAATRAHVWLIDWAGDLAATWEAYIEAKRTGTHGGRRIKPEDADRYARQFRERAEAVSDCADQIAAAIRNRGEG